MDDDANTTDDAGAMTIKILRTFVTANWKLLSTWRRTFRMASINFAGHAWFMQVMSPRLADFNISAYARPVHIK